jgi:uncharacterized FlaG/YvyC family protein
MYHGVDPTKVTQTIRCQVAQQATSNKQQATSNKQQATSNKQQATSNKQQATSNKQQAIFRSIRYLVKTF